MPTRAAVELFDRVDNRIRESDIAFVDVLAPEVRPVFAEALQRLARSIQDRPMTSTS